MFPAERRRRGAGVRPEIQPHTAQMGGQAGSMPAARAAGGEAPADGLRPQNRRRGGRADCAAPFSKHPDGQKTVALEEAHVGGFALAAASRHTPGWRTVSRFNSTTDCSTSPLADLNARYASTPPRFPPSECPPGSDW